MSVNFLIELERKLRGITLARDRKDYRGLTVRRSAFANECLGS